VWESGPIAEHSAITAAVHYIDRDLPTGTWRTTEQIVSELRAQPRVRAFVLAGFGGLTVLLAAIGVAGVTRQVVEQRRREMGIWMALGATRSDVQGLVLKHAFWLAMWGICGGFLVAIGIARLLRGLLFGVSVVDPRLFAGVVVLLAGVALVAADLPARAAGKLDPMVVLREE
jgi:putative ABC transport system permease protein